MTAPVSKHSPILAGGEVAVTGSLEIDTGLRAIQTFVPSIMTDALVANEESKVTWKRTNTSGSTVKVTLYVFKGGTNDGDPGDSAVTISWLALGE